MDSWKFQRDALSSFQPKSETAPDVVSAVLPQAVQAAQPIAKIEIKRLGIAVAVAEGTAEGTLRRAAGHIEGTALPGENGNIGLAAHRDTFFRPLRNVKSDDIISLTTARGEYRYRVISTKIVDPTDVAVLDSDGTEVLTLVTCYPFYFVGPAPKRFIVRAKRESPQGAPLPLTQVRPQAITGQSL